MEINKAELASAAAASGAAPQELRGAEILIKALQAEGVKYIWGYPGGAVLHIYDAFYKQDTIQHVLVRHEQAAVHAADGYARATGDVGVSLVTSGPGLTNAVTGIATAYMDSIPMVIIAGQVPTAAIGLDAFQECDTVGITRPIVKHNFLVKDVRDMAMVMKKAFHIARSGRPGPVVVDIPKDVSFNKTAYTGYPESVSMRSYNPVRKGHGGQIRKALQLLLSAKRPYIYTGGGVLLGNAVQELRTLVDMLGYPVTNTLMGLGAYPATDRKFLGMLGMHGTVEANNAMQNCDVLLAVGARFDDRVIGNPKHFAQNERKIIHIDIDPSSISKRVKVDVPIVGDVKDVLTELISMVRESPLRPDEKALAGWWEAIEGWRSTDCLKYDRGNKDVIKPQYVVETLWNMTKDADAYITSDVGQHQMWAAQYYKFNEPRRWINSGGLGTMGVGIPYAMGIKLAKPESEVFCVTGEGSVQMCIQELSTCLQYNTPIKIMALNNRYLGMVRQWQELDYEGRYSHSYMDALPNFVKLAEAYGHVGMLIERPQDVEGALREARKLKDRTVFMDFRTDPTENVFPMVRAGKGITEMTLGAEDL
ncbi:acetolactate synthase 3 catalytic subunit [Hydrogenophaga taeniospiralis CCUG 15921]|uniref:Acetolactate synthase n=1 Tax=Hydrogenophaga taeniospiralis CCUG 15921 TaxID=1281780 RepID=A0A9X4SDC8_9BURK|nr:acetolactate synthase 3 catalytic subunit [Hydrogenophaga taeniospiralis]MDG5973936.1 acetolactate synthase 3 catalytic subunit [Hydrogenophaga taeniospiralis CCUG 15921]